MFEGVSAFPLTPFVDDRPDLGAIETLVADLAEAGVDSIGALGSTGAYAYLDRTERRDVARAAVRAAGDVPVIVGVGALATRDVLVHIDDAAQAGAAGVLVPPMSYQPLRPTEVVGLYEEVTAATDLPVVVYDNPGTTGVEFDDEMHARISELPGVVSIKLPPVAPEPQQAVADIARLRSAVSPAVTLGVSGDEAGARGLLAGCETWYSVLAGVFPRTCLEITRAAQAGDAGRALEASAQLQPLWDLFARFGSFRTVSAVAVEAGILRSESMRHPVLPLAGAEREAIRVALRGTDMVSGGH